MRTDPPFEWHSFLGAGQSHHEILGLVPQIMTPEFRKEFLDVEDEIQKQAHAGSRDLNILEIYRNKFSWVNVSELVDKVDPRREIFLNTGRSAPFSADTAPINRLLVFLLELGNGIKLRVDRLDFESGMVSFKDERWTVKWPSYEIEHFDNIILRHGIKADYFTDRFDFEQADVDEIRASIGRFDVASALPDDVTTLLSELRNFRVSRFGA